MKEKLFKEAKDLIEASSIKNKDDLVLLISNMNEDLLGGFIELVSSDNNAIKLIAKNIEDKKSLDSMDDDEWKKFLDEEEEIIKKYQ